MAGPQGALDIVDVQRGKARPIYLLRGEWSDGSEPHTITVGCWLPGVQSAMLHELHSTDPVRSDRFVVETWVDGARVSEVVVAEVREVSRRVVIETGLVQLDHGLWSVEIPPSAGGGEPCED